MFFYFCSLIVADPPGTGEKQIEKIYEYIHDGGAFLARMALEHPNEFLTAISTAIIATFTVVLAISTVKLWRAGERHSERELRAYVGILMNPSTVIHVNVGQRSKAQITVKNFDQTPAYDVLVNTNIVPAIFPLTGKLPELDRSPTGSRTILHPGEEAYSDGQAETPIDDTEFRRLHTEHETRRLYFYGEISYRDVFRKLHTTYFRLHTTGGAATMQRFNYSYDGNEAD
jgi:hypothetical protein